MNESARTFQCPACGASLQTPGGAATMKCGYCGTSVIVPEELRATSQPNLGGSSPLGLDFGQLFARALRMGEVVRLVRAGDREDAIHLYQENSGVDAAQAEKVIDAITSGKTPDLVAGNEAAVMGQAITAVKTVREMEVEARQTRRARQTGCSGPVAFFIIVAGLLVAIQKSPGPAHDFLNHLITQFHLANFFH